MNIKSVVFDAYGTLFDVNSAAEKCKDKIGSKWERFANFWRTTQLEYTWLRSLMKRHKDFWSVTEDSLDKSMKVFNIDITMKNELLNLYKALSPYPEVKVMITANDVLHAWALPSFGVKRDAIPGRINETWFKADRTGTYYGQCSELCGIKHAFMPITVNVVTEDEYNLWLEEAKKKFAKENFGNNIKLAKKTMEIK
tara:strand:- start:263 stop:853 length:591 start_codon:yes stop_codon:yes gene_type:complete